MENKKLRSSEWFGRKGKDGFIYRANFAMIKTGDMITLDVPNRSINAAVSDSEFENRKAQFTPPTPSVERGYVSLYVNHVQQAHLGADMDFLRGKSGSRIVRDSH